MKSIPMLHTTQQLKQTKLPYLDSYLKEFMILDPSERQKDMKRYRTQNSSQAENLGLNWKT